MAQGDLTKEYENDAIEVVLRWNIQVRKATKVMEEQADGTKVELSRSFVRSVLLPFSSNCDKDGKWTHTPTDLTNEDADVKAIAEVAWTDDVKTAYKTFRESQSL